MKEHGTPRIIILDVYPASHRAIKELKSAGTITRIRVRSSKYLNNVIELDHRRIKQRIRPMLGFKRFDRAAVTIRGIELLAKIAKLQFRTGNLSGRNATAPEIWAAILDALLHSEILQSPITRSHNICTGTLFSGVNKERTTEPVPGFGTTGS